MKLPQLSLFLENKPGHLKAPCKVLADAGINLLALSLADTEQFGILRFIVRDWRKAKQVLESAGHVVNVTDVLAIDVPDRPGGLAEVLDVVDRLGLSIEYMYAFTCGARGDTAALIFRFEDPDAAVQSLTKAGIPVLNDTGLFARLNG